MEKERIRIKKFIDLFEDPDTGDLSFKILDNKIYRRYAKPMVISAGGREYARISKEKIPICDMCNRPAEYAQFWEIVDDETGEVIESYFENCLCERCKNDYIKGCEGEIEVLEEQRDNESSEKLTIRMLKKMCGRGKLNIIDNVFFMPPEYYSVDNHFFIHAGDIENWDWFDKIIEHIGGEDRIKEYSEYMPEFDYHKRSFRGLEKFEFKKDYGKILKFETLESRKEAHILKDALAIVLEFFKRDRELDVYLFWHIGDCLLFASGDKPLFVIMGLRDI